MAKPFGGTVTISATATSLATGLGLTADESVAMCSNVSIQADPGNSGTAFLGGPTVTGNTDSWASMPSTGMNYALILTDANVSLENIYVIGTASDLLHILAVQ